MTGRPPGDLRDLGQDYPVATSAMFLEALEIARREPTSECDPSVVALTVASLVARSDGRCSTDQLLAAVPGAQRGRARALLQDWWDVGLLEDARLAHATFEYASRNPGPWAPAATEEEVLSWPPFAVEGDPECLAELELEPTLLAADAPSRRRSSSFAGGRADPLEAGRGAWRLVASAARHAQGHASPTASAGSLHPVVVHAVCPNADDTADVFWYDPIRHARVAVSSVDYRQLEAALPPQVEVGRALASWCAVVVLSIDMLRPWAKYGPRGYRFALVEVGALWQLIDLYAASTGVPVRAIGGFFDTRLATLLRLPGRVSPELAVLVGCSA